MAFQKGNPKIGGRQAGTPNKTTIAAKEAFQLAFDKIGGADGLADWASNNQGDFYRLYGRLIPVEANAKIDSKFSLEQIVLDSMKPMVVDAPVQ